MARHMAWTKTVLLDLYRIFHNQFLLCGIAPNLGLLLLFRVLQGAFGGGLQPMAQAILAIPFLPRSEDWRLLCMESRPSARLLLVQRWEDG